MYLFEIHINIEGNALIVCWKILSSHLNLSLKTIVADILKTLRLAFLIHSLCRSLELQKLLFDFVSAFIPTRSKGSSIASIDQAVQ